MLTDKQAKAVEMLFQLTDKEVARRLGIEPATLDSWRKETEFTRAIADRMRENRRTAHRVISALMVDICTELASLFRDGGDPARIKLLVDVVKAAGLFRYEEETAVGEECGFLERLLDRLGTNGEESEPGEED